VTIETELGSIVMEVYTESSPVAADNFITLAQSGFYDGVVFHRIVPGFVIQGGDPEGTGRGGPGYTIEDEPVVGEYVRGAVAMARTPLPNSQGSQFFIVLDDSVQFQLDKAGGYAIFGRVLEGMDVVDQIAAGPAGQQMALEPVAMTRVTVERP
jgi:peptidyl-prolyl cis-trans isomerase B (cyclophilin B)